MKTIAPKSSQNQAASLPNHRSFRRMTQILAASLLLALLTAALYAPIVKHDYIDYDDDVYVSNNPHLWTGVNWETVKWALTTDAAGNWHPLTWISHALDCQLYGLDNPGGHHATSLVLHAVNVALLFLFLTWATGAIGPSAVVAALFAVHPFNVESVAWIAERKNVLCTTFFFLALIAYTWYVRKPGLWRYLLVALCFLLGLASKPMVITLPCVLLLLDFWPFGRVSNWSSPNPEFITAQKSFPRLLLEKAPLFVMSAASAIVTVIAQKHGNSIASISDLPVWWRLENAICSYWIYFWKAFIPVNLAPFYPTIPLSITQMTVSVFCLASLGWLVWKYSPRKPYLAVGGLWFIGTLFPVIGVLQVGSQAMADRYAYIPSIGIFFAVVWAITDEVRARRIDMRLPAFIAGSVLLVFSFLTWKQIGYWMDSVSIWTHASKVTVKNFVDEEDLAVGLANKGRDDEALPHFVTALQIKPGDPVATLNVGINLEKHGRHEAAIRQFEAVANNKESDTIQVNEAYRRMGVVFAQLKDFRKARACLMKALSLVPDDPVTMQNLSMLEIEDNVDRLSRDVSLHPSAGGYYQLGQLMEADDRKNDAQEAYESALKLNPNFSDASNALQKLQKQSR